MSRSMVTSVLALQLYLTGLATGSYVPAFDLLSRQVANCPASYTRCGNTQLPSNFCCPASTTCVSLDNSTSAICCPNPGDCAFIKPVTCNIQAQNATANPEASLKTTRLTDNLPTCGSSCCPFGYSCQDGSTCALVKDASSEASSSIQQITSTTAAASTAAAAAATSTLSLVPSVPSTALTTSPPDLAPNSTQVAQSCSAFPATAVVAGFFPGLVSGALAAAVVTMCLRRRKEKEASRRALSHQRSSGGTIIGISDPIPTDENAFRTDFLLRKGSSRYPASVRSKSMLRRTGTRVKSIFGPSPRVNGAHGGLGVPPPPPMPVTPPQQIGPRHQPSMESIKVYSPASMLASSNLIRPGIPNIHIERPNTTFSEVMEKVGFQNPKGEPYYRVTQTPIPQNGSPLRN
jgi:phosphatidylinositol glycan class S